MDLDLCDCSSVYEHAHVCVNLCMWAGVGVCGWVVGGGCESGGVGVWVGRMSMCVCVCEIDCV